MRRLEVCSIPVYPKLNRVFCHHFYDIGKFINKGTSAQTRLKILRLKRLLHIQQKIFQHQLTSLFINSRAFVAAINSLIF